MWQRLMQGKTFPRPFGFIRCASQFNRGNTNMYELWSKVKMNKLLLNLLKFEAFIQSKSPSQPLLGSSRNVPPQLTAAHSSSAFLSLNWSKLNKEQASISWKPGPFAANATRNMIGAAANSYMHVIGSQWQRERNAELEWSVVSWGGVLRDDPNNGFEGD